MKSAIFCLTLLFCLSGISLRSAEPKPNILLILSDDQRIADLGFNGSKDVSTPHIDSIAANGVIFTQARCAAPLCAPSRAGLLTGKSPARFGFDFNPEPYVPAGQGNRLSHPGRLKNGLPATEKSIATYLRQAGYNTAWIGKWHLGEAEWAQPKSHGFEHCYGFLSGVQAYDRARMPKEQRNTFFDCLTDNGNPVDDPRFLTDLLGDNASRYIRDHATQPWFMYAAFNAPHGPITLDEAREKKFAYIEEEAARLRAGAISALDDAVGRILSALTETGQLERTMIVFAGDHGVGDPPRLRGGKGTMNEGGLIAPLVISWPGKFPKQNRSNEPVSFLDLAPTFLQAAGIPIEPSMKLDGIDLAKIVSEKQSSLKRPFYWRMFDIQAMLRGRWKLVGKNEQFSLYDLQTDPAEKSDLSRGQPDIFKTMTEEWKAWDATNARPMWNPVSEGASKPKPADARKAREAAKAAIEPTAQTWTPLAPIREDGSGVTGVVKPVLVEWPSNTTAPASLENLTLGSGPISIAVSFTANKSEWTGTLLSRRAKPGEPSLTVTAFKHQPFGKRYLGVSLDGVADGPNQAAALTVRDSVIGGHLISAYTQIDDSFDDGEHDLVFRTDGKTDELFIDGVLRESRSAERFTSRTYLKLYPYASVGWWRGSDPSGGDRFPGTIENIRIANRAWSDDEVNAASNDRLSKPNRTLPAAKGYAANLYPIDWSDEQRMAATDQAMPTWLLDKFAHDKWFPHFHVALPAGMMFDTRCAVSGGRYHLFPTCRPDLILTSGVPGAFRMQHVSSADLIHWRIDPVPMRFPDRDVCNGSPATIDGKPHFFFLRYNGKNGAPHRAIPMNPELTAWSLPDPQPAISKEGDGYIGRLDSVVFQHGDKYYLTGTRRNTNKTSMAMPLYRSDDLVDWKYVGDFFQTQTKPFNECPQIFFIDGKMIVAAFYALHGREDNYLVGRFENERFIMENGGK